ncbi:hypothetical protein [Ensifer sp. B1-9]|uniref:hypothetical protein n=1 Tax=Ensifer sp. B1-9 TaxID=3141455 RepID=UPI003D1C93D8
MSKATRPFAIAAILVVIALLVFPPIFGERPVFADRTGGDPMWNFVYDFQTLITGALAVFAAVATIREMRISDAKQERRHHEQRLDANRGKLRAAANLLEFLPVALTSQIITLRVYTESENPFNNALEITHAQIVVEAVVAVLNDERVNACREFFPSEVLQLLQDSKNFADFILRNIRARTQIDTTRPAASYIDDFHLEAMTTNTEALVRNADQLVSRASDWAYKTVLDPTR